MRFFRFAKKPHKRTLFSGRSVLEIQFDREGERKDDQEAKGGGREPVIYQRSRAYGEGDDGLRDDSDQEGQASEGRRAGTDSEG